MDAMGPKPSITGYEDPAGEAPWVMQCVVRVGRSSPPSHSAVCEATAMVVVRLLADSRCQPGCDWAPAVERWLAGRIRKHVRRARGAAWERVQALPGVTVTHAGAEVRAFVPGSTVQIPRDLARLQMQGLELDDPDLETSVEPVRGGPVVVSITPDPPLPTGKAAAAAGHAAQIAWRRMPADRLAAWEAAGFVVVVEHPPVERWRELLPVVPVQIVDAGFTTVRAGVTTALARWA
jgi:peptidyl-tRNA hydrolase